MTEPNFSINFTAKMLATDGCEVGDLLVYNSDLGLWKVATSANRTAADAGAQAVALTDYGGSLVGKVTYQSSGIVANEITDLGAGTAALVRTSSTGRFERIVGDPGADDDVVGYCETDGRVKLHLGLPWSLMGDVGVSLPDGWSDESGGRLHARQVEMGNGAALLTFAASGSTITRDSGSFATDGFAIGDGIVVDGSALNDGTYTVTNVAGAVITVAEALVNEGPIGSTNIYLATQAYLTYGSTGGTFPDDGLVRVDSSTAQKLIVAQYSGGEYDVLNVSGSQIRIGDNFPTDTDVVLQAGSAGIIQLVGAEVLVGITGSYPSDSFIGSSLLVNSNLYLNHRDGSSGGVGAGRGIFVIGKRLAEPSSNPTSDAFLYLDDPTTNGFVIHFPSGNKCVVPDFNGTLPTSGGASFSDSAGLRALLSDETGTGAAVFNDTPILATPKIIDSSGGQTYNFAVSNLAADRTITLPLLTGNDVFVFEAHTQTLTNKTLTSPSISGPTISGTVIYQGTRFSIRSIPGEVQTSSTTTATVASYTMPDERHCQFDAIVTFARRTSVTKAGTYKLSVAYRRAAGGAPTIVGALVTQPDQETTASDTVTIDVSSNDVRVRVTAADTDGRNWSCELRVQETTNA